MIKTISTNIANQGTEGTCYAHTSTRIILNAIRQTIPDFFYPLEESEICDEYYDYKNMLNIFKSDIPCSEHSFNNLIIYVYIYKLITKQFGCGKEGASIVHTLNWFIDHFIYKEMGNKETILRIFSDFEGFDDKYLYKIYSICETFINQFFTIEDNEFTVESFNITRVNDVKRILTKLIGETDTSDNTNNILTIQLIKYVIDNGYYISIGGENHIMTIVNYDIQNGEFFLIIKNSYGKTTYMSSIAGTLMEEGIIKITLDETIKHHLTRFSFIFPRYIENNDKERIKREKNEQRDLLDSIDLEYRTKYKELKKDLGKGVNKKGKKKTNKKDKKKSNKKTKKNKKNKK